MNITHTDYGLDGKILSSRKMEFSAPANSQFDVTTPEGVRVSYSPPRGSHLTLPGQQSARKQKKHKNRRAKAGRQASRS